MVKICPMKGRRRFIMLTSRVLSLSAVLLVAGIFQQLSAAVNFASAVNYPTGSSPTDVAVGDFNNDGKQDIVTAHPANNSISLFLGIGNGLFGSPTNIPVVPGPTSLDIADFNGDGKLDLVTAYSAVPVVFQSYLESGTEILPLQ
jgi:hypothetical protein